MLISAWSRRRLRAGFDRSCTAVRGAVWARLRHRNAAFQIGGALGVARFSTVAVSQTSGNGVAALTHGYHSLRGRDCLCGSRCAGQRAATRWPGAPAWRPVTISFPPPTNSVVDRCHKSRAGGTDRSALYRLGKRLHAVGRTSISEWRPSRSAGTSRSARQRHDRRGKISDTVVSGDLHSPMEADWPGWTRPTPRLHWRCILTGEHVRLRALDDGDLKDLCGCGAIRARTCCRPAFCDRRGLGDYRAIS